jgi:hypothetical protein
VASYQKGTPILITDTFYLNGVATNPTAIVYTITGPDGDPLVFNWPGDPEVSNTGVGEFELSLSPPAFAGHYVYDVDATGTVTASRQGSFDVLPDSIPQDVDWAVAGPCTAWSSSQSVWECCGQPTTTIDGVICNVDFTADVIAASEILFELSGRLYSGTCEKTVRPCTPFMCGFQVLSRGHIVAPYGYTWSGSAWGVDACGCYPLDRVLLSGYPVREITEVKIDGDVVDPDTYRLDNRRWLSRVRDPAEPDVPLFWPSCQMMDLPDTEDGTFSVSYRYGQDPPLAGVRAATALACQLHQACDGGGGDCEIPANAVRVTRQGVTIDRNATIAWFYGKNDVTGWSTGIPAVDVFLNGFNESGMQQRPRTWSPDGHRYARTVGQ